MQPKTCWQLKFWKPYVAVTIAGIQPATNPFEPFANQFEITANVNKPVRSLKIVFSAHVILSRISHLLLFNQEQKKVKTNEDEKFGIKSHTH